MPCLFQIHLPLLHYCLNRVAHNQPKPFYFTVQPRPQPTAQNWFSISWNLGTRHLFSYVSVVASLLKCCSTRIHINSTFQIPRNCKKNVRNGYPCITPYTKGPIGHWAIRFWVPQPSISTSMAPKKMQLTLSLFLPG